MRKRANPPSKIRPGERRYQIDDGQVSPTSQAPRQGAPRGDIAPWESGPQSDIAPWQSAGAADIAPWDTPDTRATQPTNLHNYQTNLNGPSAGGYHQGLRQPKPDMRTVTPKSPPPPPPPPKDGPVNSRGSHNGRPQPPTRPDHLPTESGTSTPNHNRYDDSRRHSIISTTSSTGSGRSRNQTNLTVQKKLQGWFGEDDLSKDHRRGSSTSLQRVATSADRVGEVQPPLKGKVSSPSGNSSISRPLTPQPSSEVTPWMYQDAKDIGYFGDAPVRDNPDENARLERQRTSEPSNKASGHSSRFHIHRHRTTKSSEDGSNNANGDTYPLQPSSTTKTEMFPPLRRDTTLAQPSPGLYKTATGLSAAPSFSDLGGDQGDGASSRPNDTSGGHKRSIFDRLRHRNKGDRTGERSGSDPSKQEPRSSPTSQPLDRLASNSVSANQSNASFSMGAPLEPVASSRAKHGGSESVPQQQKKEGHSRLPFKKRTGASEASAPMPQNPNNVRSDINSNEAIWDLDTDLQNMEGIVHNDKVSATTPAKGSVDQKQPSEDSDPVGQAAWDAPDSWAVKRVGDENMEKLYEIDETKGLERTVDPGLPHSARIFRPDGTFATVTVGLHTSAAELVSLLGKKNFPNDDINGFRIVMHKQEMSRVLEPGEQPLAIQRRLLQQAGYDDADQIEEIGRDDHSYLCRFNFVPAKMLGFTGLDKDLSLHTKQKFSHVELQGRNLDTIPIALYHKSSEITFLNISRNLCLGVPKDFIGGCTSLREIRYAGNEASRLPSSFSMATKLILLDVSNNRLDQLEHAELEKLPMLASLKLSNNRLRSIPESFANFRSLRSLNLSSNFLPELPVCLCKLTTLVDLDISFNALESLPHIGGLTNLERLWATNNKLSGRPEDAVANLKSLKEIDLRFNFITNIDVLSQLPQLEHLLAGHNSISAFEGTFTKIRSLYLDHNPVTRFGLGGPTPSLVTLSLAAAKLSQLPEDLFMKTPGLTKLILTKNHFTSLPQQIGKLQKLDHLSMAKNDLSTLPPEIGRLFELRFLDVRENNINVLPVEIWLCRKLETFNVSSNVMESFPKPPTQASLAGLDLYNTSQPNTPAWTASAPIAEEPDSIGDSESTRRPSQASQNRDMAAMNSAASSPNSTHRKGSMASLYAPNGRKPSLLSRTPTENTMSPVSRKDSLLATRVTSTFAGSLRHLFLAENRLPDDVFDQLTTLQELRILNLSYNLIYDIPSRSLRRWPLLLELYLSGNELTSLPAEDFEDGSGLKVLHINGNKFQVLPAELGKVQKLAVLDASSNALKYNVTNWPYDWNWNWNRNLRYLSLSGNRRLEIKPSSAYTSGREKDNLTDFSSLANLRVLGLMDVTLMIMGSSVPDQTEDRRVRTSGSNVANMPYGIADSLGNNEHLSTIDIVVPRLEGHEDETLIGLFDGVPSATGGSKIVKYLQENFERQLKEELRQKPPEQTVMDALRRTYLTLNKELATWAIQAADSKDRRGHRGSVVSQSLTKEDLMSGCVATVLYLHGMELFVSNVGNAEALLIQSGGSHRVITQKHDPAEPSERLRIREAGGYVSRQGKLNDAVDVSRAFGFTQLMPAMHAAPHTSRIQIQESDEMILLASRELWDYLTPDLAVDIARYEPNDLMRGAQKLRDLAISFGASGKITVMLIGVSDLRRKERARFRTPDMGMAPGQPDDYMNVRRGKRGRDVTLDQKLARLDQEVEPPTGDVSLVFTDIKNSTMLWETYPIAMRSAIRMHNDTMRRHLRLIGGYEVKTEGDAFMVAFPTVTSALLWCFTIQSQLLEVQWPQEILTSVNGQEVCDSEGNVLFRGLSVRMGIHWGPPVCETDPVTRRMDYFGPMVNRAARISAVADGGQITVSSDFIAEVQRLLETHIESERQGSSASEETANEEGLSPAIRRELRSLSSHGFEVKDLGEKRLKGLENPEYIYLMYPHSLAARIVIQQKRADAEKTSTEGAGTKAKDSQLTIELDNVWDLWNLSLRLEMLCSTLENTGSLELKAPETALLERTRERGGEVTDHFLVNFVEHQISRIETCATSLALRNLVRPFKDGLVGSACPMTDIFNELKASLDELKTIKASADFEMAES